MTEYGVGVFDRHADLLRASAISPEIAQARGYVSVDTKTRLEHAGFSRVQRRAPGLLIPVWGVDGQIVGHEYRPDVPRVTEAGRTLKYEKPAGCVNRLDVPPSVRANLADPSVPLWITEGARKVDSAVTARLCCVGLAGVWGWRATDRETRGKVALADFESVAFNGREVVLAFDSDVMTKPEVAEALRRLRRFLGNRGARVRVCVLPDLGDGKTGLDDYLAAGHTTHDLAALIVDQLDDAAALDAVPAPAPAREPAEPRSLAEVVETYRRWLHLPDPGQVEFALAVVAANCAPGDPVWGLVVGASGSGKTETIGPTGVLPFVHAASSITGEAAFLSASNKRDRERNATGGLLRQVGDFGIMLIRDFSGVLSMHRDARGQVVAALRVIFDGEWNRTVGTGGGQTLRWKGQCGFLGACTPSIDRHHAVMGPLGERFVLFRIEVEPTAQARRRLANRGHEKQMRDELADAVRGLFEYIDTTRPPRQLTDGEIDWLVNLAAFVVRARTAVERDGYNHDVVVMPADEAPGRLVGSLGQLLSGLETIGCTTSRAHEIVTKTAWDCVPEIRRRLLHALRADTQRLLTAQLVTATGIPKNTAERALEDLVLVGLTNQGRISDGETAAKCWTLTPDATTAWPTASPELSGSTCADPGPEPLDDHGSESLNNSLLSNDDISGEAIESPDALDHMVAALVDTFDARSLP